MAAKFTIYKDKSNKFRFRLIATNGEIIAVGEAYNTKAACLNGVKSIRKNAPDAVLIDETVPGAVKTAPKKKPARKKAAAKKTAAKKATAKKAAK